MSHPYPAHYFKMGDRIHLRAQQIWMILVSCAMNGRTITYGDLAESMGYDRKGGRATIKPLAIIATYCMDNDLPQLNALVVNHTTGEPGHEVILKEGETSSQAQQQVFDFDWFEVRMPSPGAFRRVWKGFGG